jgi:hypothetical protein
MFSLGLYIERIVLGYTHHPPVCKTGNLLVLLMSQCSYGLYSTERKLTLSGLGNMAFWSFYRVGWEQWGASLQNLQPEAICGIDGEATWPGYSAMQLK